MLEEWIGREEKAHDEVTAPAVRRLAALLDLSPDHYRRGTTIPGPWYVVLFGPEARQSTLGPDGHPAKGQFLPPVPLPRRMFAGRRVWFHAPLAIGDEVSRVSRIKAITPKQGRSGAMCFVTVRHEIAAPARPRGGRGAGPRLSRGDARRAGEARSRAGATGPAGPTGRTR